MQICEEECRGRERVWRVFVAVGIVVHDPKRQQSTVAAPVVQIGRHSVRFQLSDTGKRRKF